MDGWSAFARIRIASGARAHLDCIHRIRQAVWLQARACAVVCLVLSPSLDLLPWRVWPSCIRNATLRCGHHGHSALPQPDAKYRSHGCHRRISARHVRRICRASRTRCSAPVAVGTLYGSSGPAREFDPPTLRGSIVRIPTLQLSPCQPVPRGRVSCGAHQRSGRPGGVRQSLSEPNRKLRFPAK